VKHWRISDTGAKFILMYWESMKLKFKFEQHEFNHLVLVANITDDVLMGLKLMNQHKFHLDLENSVIKTNRDEFSVKMAEQTAKKVTLQINVQSHGGKTLSGRLQAA